MSSVFHYYLELVSGSLYLYAQNIDLMARIMCKCIAKWEVVGVKWGSLSLCLLGLFVSVGLLEHFEIDCCHFLRMIWGLWSDSHAFAKDIARNDGVQSSVSRTVSRAAVLAILVMGT